MGAGGFFDFDFGDIFAQALESSVLLASGLLSNSLSEDQAKNEQKFAAEQSALDFQRQKELIALRGGGAGPAKPFLGFTGPQRVAAMQGQDQNQQAAIANAIAAYQRALIGG